MWINLMHKMSETTKFTVILIVTLLQLSSLSSARILFFKSQFNPLTPLNAPALAPNAPIFSPIPQPPISPGFAANPPHQKHHKRHYYSPPAFSPSFSPPKAGCDEILCSEPLTATPIDSPCGCVLPIKLTINLQVAPYLLFTHIAELEIQIAAGTFLKQSQVKIMAAVPSQEDQQKTRVTVYLVPLREKFDDMTSLLIYDRVWQKSLVIDPALFGDYEVVSVNYPGLPSSPPSASDAFKGMGPTKQRPLTADVHGNKNQETKTRELNSWIIIIVTVSSCALVAACVALILFLYRWRNVKLSDGGSVCPTVTNGAKSRRFAGLRSTTLSTSMASSSVSATSAVGPTTYPPSVKTFSLDDLSKATDDFSNHRILGEGGFGRVYRGTLESGTEVAVKLLTREDRSGDREFVAEVEMLSRLHHRNLVKLIGICIDGNRRCLVYELITNGSVESHLHGVDKEKGQLNWDTRMKIALGAARGLAYLHEDSNPRVIHRDFKASNILLEDDFTPKVTDFGLAREAPEGTHHISTRVMGTFGYVAPEYAMTGHVLVKSDVYSYGVVLLELLSGRKPVYMSQSQGPENLVVWARSLLGTREGLLKLIDPSLNNQYDFENVAKVASIASMCVHTEVTQRPFMGEVVQALKLVCHNMNECEEEYSNRESESNGDFECSSKGEWWNFNESLSGFVNMECYSSGGVAGDESGVMSNRSGPLRSKNRFGFASFYRLKGSLSDHAGLPKHSRINRS